MHVFRMSNTQQGMFNDRGIKSLYTWMLFISRSVDLCLLMDIGYSFATWDFVF